MKSTNIKLDSFLYCIVFCDDKGELLSGVQCTPCKYVQNWFHKQFCELHLDKNDQDENATEKDSAQPGNQKEEKRIEESTKQAYPVAEKIHAFS